MRARGVRAELDKGDERMNAKIRNAQNQKVPFMLILGEKEQSGAHGVPAHAASGEQKNLIPLEEFLNDRGRGEAQDPGLTREEWRDP